MHRGHRTDKPDGHGGLGGRAALELPDVVILGSHVIFSKVKYLIVKTTLDYDVSVHHSTVVRTSGGGANKGQGADVRQGAVASALLLGLKRRAGCSCQGTNVGARESKARELWRNRQRHGG